MEYLIRQTDTQISSLSNTRATMSSILRRVNYSVMQHPSGDIVFMLLAMIGDDHVCLDDFTPGVSKAAVKANLHSGPWCHVAKRRRGSNEPKCIGSFVSRMNEL